MDLPKEFDRLAALGSPGIASLGILRNLMCALRAKGVFSDIELLAICDATAEQAARHLGSNKSGRLAQSVERDIRQLQDSVLKPASPSQAKH